MEPSEGDIAQGLRTTEPGAHELLEAPALGRLRRIAADISVISNTEDARIIKKELIQAIEHIAIKFRDK